jgi:exodeoxyribonuclease V alpha subunit
LDNQGKDGTTQDGMLLDTLKTLAENHLLRDLDWQFARWIGKLSGDTNPSLALAAALVSHRVSQGDVCVNLSTEAGKAVFSGAPDPGPLAPELSTWIAGLKASPAVAPAGGDHRPLVLDGQRLYLARYWHFEKTLADAMRRLAQAPVDIDGARLESGLDALFPAATPGEVSGQRVAAAMAAWHRLCIISGGPGTGKTHTVAAILALFTKLAGPKTPRMVLAAPTGKAAARLTESIRNAREHLRVSSERRAAIPTEAMTLHRLIGVRPGRATPRYGPDNPLHLDVLIIDEASMIDLSLMCRVVVALPRHARLILLGDKDQLASVEAGSVFADLCGNKTQGYSRGLCNDLKRYAGYTGAGDPNPSAIGDCVALLNKSYRFGTDSGIGNLARTVNEGSDPSPVFGSGYPDIAHEALTPEEIPEALGKRAVAGYREMLEAKEAGQALAALEKFRILCATREGPAGVVESNRSVEKALRASDMIAGDGPLYRGKPMMVTRNDYALDLFNGDLGILWPDPDGVLRAWFLRPDGSLKQIAPSRLPVHETAFAMTVHKSQGSEFDRVLLLLPDRDVRVLTRELLYTGITRARSHLEIWGSGELLRTAAARVAKRTSGLADRLWNR